MFVRFWMILTTVIVLTSPVVGDEIKIATWNIENLGRTKAGLKNTDNSIAHEANDTMGKIAKIMKQLKVDLIAIQEVEDIKRLTLPKLKRRLGGGWDYIESETTGREQYAIFFKIGKVEQKNRIHPCKHKEEIVKDSKCAIRLYNDKENDKNHFSRDLGYAKFSYKDQDLEFVIITCHLDPDNPADETKRLDEAYDTLKKDTQNPNIIVLGDFNLEDGPADPAFKDGGLLDEKNYPTMKAVLDEKQDTTLAGKDDQTTFDNILFDSDQFKLKEKGVYCFDKKLKLLKGCAEAISDHYPVWATFEIPEVDDE